MTHLRIIVIVSLRFCPWNGNDPVSISNCTQHPHPYHSQLSQPPSN